MKTFTRLLALLLACLSLVALVVACAEVTYDPDDLLIDAAYDAKGRLRDDLPSTLNYGGEKINVMHWKAENSEFEITDVSKNNVENAIYDRNDQIQRRLNVDLEWSECLGHSGMVENFVNQVAIYAESSTATVDIIATYAPTMGVLAIRGYMMDFAKIQKQATEANPFYVSLDKPWWPQQLVETVSFGNSYYFLSGDISTNVLYMMHMLYINKDMFTEKKIELPYSKVYDGTWTLDELIQITTGIYKNGDAIPGKSAGDTFGLVGRSYVLDAFYVGSNMHYILADTSDAGNLLNISSDLSSSKTVKLVSKLGDMFASNDWMTRKFGDQTGEDIEDISTFAKGRALVVQQHAQIGEKNLMGKVNFEFGVLPMPKYDTNQKNYYTNVGNPITLYGLFVGMDNRGDMPKTLSMMSAVLECWASEGYRLTTPEIFNVNMQLKVAEDQTETDMFEYIRSGITFDIGRFFATELGQVSTRVGYCMATNSSWSTYWGAYSRSLQASLTEIVEDFKEYEREHDY